MASLLSPYAPRSGCPLCSIASTPYMNLSAPLSPRTPAPTSVSSTQPQIIFKDNNVTAYIERNHPVSGKGHIIIVLNLHVPSIYTLSSTDLPLLLHIQSLAGRLLRELHSPSPSSLRPQSPIPPSPAPFHSSAPLDPPTTPTLRIGFITPPFKDSKIPVTDHVHCHAYVGTPDLAGWWRAVAYGPLAWYAIDDLIAEIRESTSNNRVKSGYSNRPLAPIDMVPGAGVRSGGADGVEEPFVPLPLHINKAHLSPSPSPQPDHNGHGVTSARAPRPRKPITAIGLTMMNDAASMEDLQAGSGGNVKGSVDLGTGYSSIATNFNSGKSGSHSRSTNLRVITGSSEDVGKKWRPVSMSSDADGDAPEGHDGRQPSPVNTPRRLVSRQDTLSPPTVR